MAAVDELVDRREREVAAVDEREGGRRLVCRRLGEGQFFFYLIMKNYGMENHNCKNTHFLHRTRLESTQNRGAF